MILGGEWGKKINHCIERTYVMEIPKNGLFPVGSVKPGVEREVMAFERATAGYNPGGELAKTTRTRMKKYGKRWAIRTEGCPCGIPYGSAPWLEAIITRPDLLERYLDTLVERAAKNIPIYADYGV